jgi:hypothetical protein
VLRGELRRTRRLRAQLRQLRRHRRRS